MTNQFNNSKLEQSIQESLKGIKGNYSDVEWLEMENMLQTKPIKFNFFASKESSYLVVAVFALLALGLIIFYLTTTKNIVVSSQETIIDSLKTQAIDSSKIATNSSLDTLKTLKDTLQKNASSSEKADTIAKKLNTKEEDKKDEEEVTEKEKKKKKLLRDSTSKEPSDTSSEKTTQKAEKKSSKKKKKKSNESATSNDSENKEAGNNNSTPSETPKSSSDSL